jgi:hypothetical protein
MEDSMWETIDCGLISVKLEDFLTKWLGNARSGPSVRPIRRPRTAGDVATFPGLGLVRDSYKEISLILNNILDKYINNKYKSK